MNLWQPASEQPIGGWFVTAREGEKGLNITQRIREDEWADGDGATTITHSTFLPPTHYLPGDITNALHMHGREPILVSLMRMVQCYGGSDGGGHIDIIVQAVRAIRRVEPDFKFEDY